MNKIFLYLYPIKEYTQMFLLKDDSLSEEQIREKRIEIFEETESLLKKIDRDDIRIVDAYFNEINKKDALNYYKDFIDKYIFDKLDNEILASYLVRNTMANLNKNEVTFEDLAPIIYLHYKIFGTKVKSKLRHVIVDEAQDYGEDNINVMS